MKKPIVLFVSLVVCLLILATLGLLFLSELGAVGEVRLLKEINFVRYTGVFLILIGIMGYANHLLRRTETRKM